MQLITDDICAQLLANGARSAARDDIDPHPVVKLFTPDASATWLISEADPSDPDLLFGLCDLGLGSPELGYVRLSEAGTASAASPSIFVQSVGLFTASPTRERAAEIAQPDRTPTAVSERTPVASAAPLPSRTPNSHGLFVRTGQQE